MKKSVIGLIFIALVMTALALPVTPATASSEPTRSNNQSISLPLADGHCECVDYIVYKLLGGRRAPGNWPTAYSMADSGYWDRYGYFRRNGAGSGDVIIIGPSVLVGVPNDWWGDMQYRFRPDSAGHIGIVTRADYDGQRNGWYIAMRSANWGVGSPSYNDASCNNVNDSVIFVPNGDATSFWHRN